MKEEVELTEDEKKFAKHLDKIIEDAEAGRRKYRPWEELREELLRDIARMKREEIAREKVGKRKMKVPHDRPITA